MVFSADTVIKSPDGFHIGRKISGGIYHGTKPANLASIVEKTENNRNFCAAGDMVESGFPFDDALARPGRRDGQYKLFIVLKLLN